MRKREHNEFTRVQLPAALHLTRLGYTYLSSSSRELKERDITTNILVAIFKQQFLKFNDYVSETDFEREFENIRLELEQDDIGRSFFNRIHADSGYTYINWDNIEENTFHIALEVTCQNGEEEFRPDITVFITASLSVISKSSNQMLFVMEKQELTLKKNVPSSALKIKNSDALIISLNSSQFQTICPTMIVKVSSSKGHFTVLMPILVPSSTLSRKSRRDKYSLACLA